MCYSVMFVMLSYICVCVIIVFSVICVVCYMCVLFCLFCVLCVSLHTVCHSFTFCFRTYAYLCAFAVGLVCSATFMVAIVFLFGKLLSHFANVFLCGNCCEWIGVCVSVCVEGIPIYNGWVFCL